MSTEIPQVKFIRYMMSHNSGNIHGENLHIERSNEKNHFSKTKNIFSQKNYTTLIGTLRLQEKRFKAFM